MWQVLMEYLLSERVNVVHHWRLGRFMAWGRLSKEGIFKCGLGARGRGGDES